MEMNDIKEILTKGGMSEEDATTVAMYIDAYVSPTVLKRYKPDETSLKDKKTGEVVKLDDIIVCTSSGMLKNRAKHYDTIAELNEELEDYEEPKEFWFIDDVGEIEAAGADGSEEEQSSKEIGNYFESKEEAERAVEKLKAWKRLKDKGLSLKLNISRGYIDYRIDLTPLRGEEIRGIAEDLELLFGEEKE